MRSPQLLTIQRDYNTQRNKYAIVFSAKKKGTYQLSRQIFIYIKI